MSPQSQDSATSADAAASVSEAAESSSQTHFSRTLLRLLQEPPLIPIKLNVDPLKKAADKLSLSENELVRYHQIIDDIAEQVVEINRHVADENHNQDQAIAATEKTGELYIGAIADYLEKLKATLRQLDDLTTLKNRPLMTAIKYRIEKVTVTLSKEVRKRTQTDADGRAVINFQTHAFYCEQHWIETD